MSKMETYIGCKQIKAIPMTDLEFKYRATQADTGGGAPGYMVEYEDGYQSWSPKEVFEKAYFKMTDPSKITQDMVEDFIHTVEVSRDRNHTVCHAFAVNGMSFIDSSACVDEKNYDEKIGRDIACKKISDKIWLGLGFLLACARNGINNK